MKLLALNGSIRAAAGNTHRALALGRTVAEANGHEWQTIQLATYSDRVDQLYETLRTADAWLLASGVYWGSWGSPLQRFLEVLTPLETTPSILGKPVGVLLTCDSTDGMSIAARLLGVLTHFGCCAPPCATLVLSRLGQRAIDADDEDVWRPSDIATVIHNLASAAHARPAWHAWPVQPVSPLSGPYPAPGALPLMVEDF